IRPDGTVKPELEVLRTFAQFFEKAAPYLDDFEPDPVVVVIPQSKIFAGRPRAVDGTKNVIRALSDHLGIVPTAIAELALTPARLRDARLIIVPSPEMMDPAAIDLLGQVGVPSLSSQKLLLIGPLERDDDARDPKGASLNRHRAVRLREPTHWGAAP